jgi:hypothetical protein
MLFLFYFRKIKIKRIGTKVDAERFIVSNSLIRVLPFHN